MKQENHIIGNGVRCLTLADSRFKTAQITVALLLPLTKETVEENALLARLLVRNCAQYPDFTALNRRLNELYGATVSGEVSRVGEVQALVFTAEATADRFAFQGEKVTAACADLLRDMLFRPAFENGCFRAEDVEPERRCLAEEVRAEINEKRWYARCQAERLLCPNEAYSIGRYGSTEVIESLTPERLTAAWKRVLQQASVQLILQDNCVLSEVEDAFCREFAAVEGRQPVPCFTDTATRMPTLRRKVERMDVGQSKLVMGFRTDYAEPQREVSAVRLMNALFGGTATSLLFRNVREKLSLCYYCSSAYDRVKGVLLVQSGVDEQNAVRAETEILAQRDLICRGEFTEEDLEAARRSVVQSFEAVNDSQSARAAWYVVQSTRDDLRKPEEIREEIAAVTREEVIAAAQKLQYECVYMLAPKEEATDE
ncbi:MAG: insulinase family protein [Clostridia bacterium]|nr:insulinase family protein [Clostridia bacterium]